LTSDLPGLRSGWYSQRGGEATKISSEGFRKGRNRLLGSVNSPPCLPINTVAIRNITSQREVPTFEHAIQMGSAAHSPPHTSIFFLLSLVHVVGGGVGRILIMALWVSVPAMKTELLEVSNRIVWEGKEEGS
jgi:hypothetical protein